jgi:hypothetical protein
MESLDPGSIRHSELANFKRLLRDALSAEEILLYDAAGRPIRRSSESELWTDGQAAWRRLAHEILDQLLNEIPADKIPNSPEDLVEILKTVSQSKPKYTFDIVDGKLLLPFHASIRGVDLKGSIPLYRIGLAMASVAAGVSLFRKPQATDSSEQVPIVNSQQSSETILVISSHQDLMWLHRFLHVLEPIVGKESINVLPDCTTQSPESYAQAFAPSVSAAKVVVLLVSINLLNSRCFMDVVLLNVVARSVEKGNVVWIAVGPCPYFETRFRALQAANNPDRPLATLRGIEAERELIRIAKIIDQLRSKGKAAQP